MKMRKSVLGIILVLSALILSGCTFLFVSRSRPYTPGYCYDCHAYPRWHRVHTRCSHYEIVLVRDGYRYRPYKAPKHVKFKFNKYDIKRDKEVRERKQKEIRERRAKESKKETKEKEERKEKKSRRR